MKFCPVCGTEYPNDVAVCKQDRTILRVKTADNDALLGAVLKGTFRIDERIAVGGMSTIYRGTQLALERPVAIKVLLPHLAPDETFVKRFFREAKLLGALSHPNVVAFFDCGQTEQGLVYLVTEFLDGRTLENVIPRDRGLPFSTILLLMTDICAAVAEAHAHHIVHRDLKPSNVIILSGQGMRPLVKVLDFGIAKSLEKHSQELTQAGAIVGTPGYMAPEQIKAAYRADPRADIYALGALLYLMTAGRPAYAEGTGYERLRVQLSTPPPRIDLEALGKPAELNRVIEKAMALDPADRYATAAELADAIARCAHRLDGAPGGVDEAGDETVLEADYRQALAQASVSAGAGLGGIAVRGSALSSSATERSLQRERLFGRVMAVALLAALAGAGFLAYQQYFHPAPERTVIHEVEEPPPAAAPPAPPDR